MQSPTLAAAVGNLEAEAIAQVKILPNGLRLEKIDLAFLLLKKKDRLGCLFVLVDRAMALISSQRLLEYSRWLYAPNMPHVQSQILPPPPPPPSVVQLTDEKKQFDGRLIIN